MEITKSVLYEATAAFLLTESPMAIRRYGSGHINDTFLVTCSDRRYILQRINTSIFHDPVSLMRNIERVTTFLRNEIIRTGGDPDRETLNLVKTRNGEDYYPDPYGNYWRIYYFIEDATCYDLVRRPEDFYQSGVAFGHFQRMLAAFPANELYETIPDFHNTPRRFENFKKAAEEDPLKLADGVRKEIDFFLDRCKDCAAATKLYEDGQLPLRVTHNDTKLNNIMIDNRSGQALCIIDLDTVMPGFSIFDFGDSIRFGANTAEEDEKNLNLVSLSLPLYEIYCRGFMEGCAGSLTKTEIEMLPQGARLMTLECGMRFLADYLQGDVYFQVAHPGHNLDRARTQIALIKDMENKWDEIVKITKRVSEQTL